MNTEQYNTIQQATTITDNNNVQHNNLVLHTVRHDLQSLYYNAIQSAQRYSSSTNTTLSIQYVYSINPTDNDQRIVHTYGDVSQWSADIAASVLSGEYQTDRLTIDRYSNQPYQQITCNNNTTNISNSTRTVNNDTTNTYQPNVVSPQHITRRPPTPTIPNSSLLNKPPLNTFRPRRSNTLNTTMHSPQRAEPLVIHSPRAVDRLHSSLRVPMSPVSLSTNTTNKQLKFEMNRSSSHSSSHMVTHNRSPSPVFSSYESSNGYNSPVSHTLSELNISSSGIISPISRQPSQHSSVLNQWQITNLHLNQSNPSVHIPYTQSDCNFMSLLQHGIGSDIGPRSVQEDTTVCELHLEHIVAQIQSQSFDTNELNLDQHSLYAVFDGHNGSHAAVYCKQHLSTAIAQHINNNTSLGKSIQLGIYDIENILLQYGIDSLDQSGTVFALVLISGRQYYVAHCGDTRVVISRAGQAVPLTKDHRTLVGSALHDKIAVSHALGDIDLETNSKISGLSSDIELNKYNIIDDDEFIIIGCDGIYDVMSNQAAVTTVRKSLQQHNDVQRAADELIYEALRRNTDDNVTCIIIGLSKPSCNCRCNIHQVNTSNNDTFTSPVSNDTQCICQCVVHEHVIVPQHKYSTLRSKQRRDSTLQSANSSANKSSTSNTSSIYKSPQPSTNTSIPASTVRRKLALTGLTSLLNALNDTNESITLNKDDEQSNNTQTNSASVLSVLQQSSSQSILQSYSIH